jgi:hypothetical protein
MAISFPYSEALSHLLISISDFNERKYKNSGVLHLVDGGLPARKNIPCLRRHGISIYSLSKGY